MHRGTCSKLFACFHLEPRIPLALYPGYPARVASGAARTAWRRGGPLPCLTTACLALEQRVLKWLWRHGGLVACGGA